VKTIPALSFSEEEVNNNVVNSSNGIMQNLLSSTHTIEKRVNDINNNPKNFGEELLNEWKNNGQRGVKIGKCEVPTDKQLYRFIVDPTFNSVDMKPPNLQDDNEEDNEEDNKENKVDNMNVDENNFVDNNNKNIELLIEQLKNNVSNVEYIINQNNVNRHGSWFLNDSSNVRMILEDPYNDKANQCVWNLDWKSIHLEKKHFQVTHNYKKDKLTLNIYFRDKEEFKLWTIVYEHFLNLKQ